MVDSPGQWVRDAGDNVVWRTLCQASVHPGASPPPSEWSHPLAPQQHAEQQPPQPGAEHRSQRESRGPGSQRCVDPDGLVGAGTAAVQPTNTATPGTRATLMAPFYSHAHGRIQSLCPDVLLHSNLLSAAAVGEPSSTFHHSSECCCESGVNSALLL